MWDSIIFIDMIKYISPQILVGTVEYKKYFFKYKSRGLVNN